MESPASQAWSSTKPDPAGFVLLQLHLDQAAEDARDRMGSLWQPLSARSGDSSALMESQGQNSFIVTDLSSWRDFYHLLTAGEIVGKDLSAT